MMVHRCPSPVRDFLASSKHPPRRMSTATPPFLGPHMDVKRAGDASRRIAAPRRSAQSGAEMSARSHANGAAHQVIFFVNAAPPNGGHWATRADVSRWLMNAPGGNE